MLLLAATLLTLSPRPATELAAYLTGAPSEALQQVVWRESRARWQGEHLIDSHLSVHVCQRAVAVGWLASHTDCTSGGWSTRGIAGLMAAYNLRWIWLDRWPWVLDIPFVSALAAGRKYRAKCPGKAYGWCPRSRDPRHSGSGRRSAGPATVRLDLDQKVVADSYIRAITKV